MDLFLIFKDFLTNQKQRSSIYGNFRLFQSVNSDVLWGKVLYPPIFILYAVDMWNDLENTNISRANDTTLYV